MARTSYVSYDNVVTLVNKRLNNMYGEEIIKNILDATREELVNILKVKKVSSVVSVLDLFEFTIGISNIRLRLKEDIKNTRMKEVDTKVDNNIAFYSSPYNTVDENTDVEYL